MTEPNGPWGPYRATIEDHLDICADYLSRLRRSLASEIAPDRHYFADKAHQLHVAARRMVRLVQDVDSWLGECTARPEHVDPDGTRFTVDCSLPAGHPGDHDDGNQPLPGRRVTGDLRDLADAVEQISHHFAWTAPAIDRDLTGAPGTIANSRDALANLADSLDTIARRGRRLAVDARIAALHAPGPAATADTHTANQHPDPPVRWPSLEL
jgi:hypothetical protein